MKSINSIAELRSELQAQRQNKRSIGLVPTMGNLHQGHIELVNHALSCSDYVVSTIFVNPLQFGPNEDLRTYPRSLEQDTEKLRNAGCHCLFAPAVKEIFGNRLEAQTILHVPVLSERHCGKSRPGHFDGVATVVCKLFNIVEPDSAYFGLKDYQQFVIIQKIVNDLGFAIQLAGVETVREESGLALSSRNNYLSDEELQIAANIYRCLTDAKACILSGNKDYGSIEDKSLQIMKSVGLDPDYFSICNAHDLEPAHENDTEIIILAAANLGATRLIDNIQISL
ncbi:MAG: pantoate--beta-alanine ligase [Gammaproteobacteria bacterium]|nr:pantoate--beta-alanine ligase [Gammaproteobacteria bacterium]MDD9960170.1 pantoate--beta-alanine ligase [Gammaproteobacteria bacterium]